MVLNLGETTLDLFVSCRWTVSDGKRRQGGVYGALSACRPCLWGDFVMSLADKHVLLLILIRTTGMLSKHTTEKTTEDRFHYVSVGLWHICFYSYGPCEVLDKPSEQWVAIFCMHMVKHVQLVIQLFEKYEVGYWFLKCHRVNVSNFLHQKYGEVLWDQCWLLWVIW